jgi:hypothetical protein
LVKAAVAGEPALFGGSSVVVAATNPGQAPIEISTNPVIAVTLLALPGATFKAFHIAQHELDLLGAPAQAPSAGGRRVWMSPSAASAMREPGGDGRISSSSNGGGDYSDESEHVQLPLPTQFPIKPIEAIGWLREGVPASMLLLAGQIGPLALEVLDDEYPTVPKIGGVTLGGEMFVNNEVQTSGLAGLLMESERFSIDAVTCQGCQPIGEPYVITGGQRNHVHSLQLLDDPSSKHVSPVEVMHDVVKSQIKRDRQTGEPIGHAVCIGLSRSTPEANGGGLADLAELAVGRRSLLLIPLNYPQLLALRLPNSHTVRCSPCTHGCR